MMAGTDGLTLLDHLHQHHPDLLVIMVTAVHDISVAMAAIRRGAYDYLLKPFEREQLLAVVKRATRTIAPSRSRTISTSTTWSSSSPRARTCCATP